MRSKTALNVFTPVILPPGLLRLAQGQI
jgi:hypothetical protein